MGKKKKVSAPVYEEMQDTPYITGLREDLPTYRDQYNYMLGQLDVTSPEVQKAFQDKANEYTQAQWNDFNRNALANYKAMNQANYNRFGNLGSSGAMYGNDTFNRQLNDLATRIAGQTAGQYENLMNNYYNQKYNTAQMYGGAYGNAGQTTYGHDQQNWNIRNRNIEAKYVADVQNANRGGGFLDGVRNIVGGAAQGAGNGFSVAGPWGALAGGIAGGVGGTLDTIGGTAGQQNSWTNILAPNIGGSFGFGGNNSGSVNLNTQGGNIFTNTSSGYNPWRLNTRY